VRCLAELETGQVREVDWDATDGRAPKWRWRGCPTPWRVLSWRPIPMPCEDVEAQLLAAEARLAEYRLAVAKVLEEVAGGSRPSDPLSYLPPRLVDAMRDLR